MESKAIICTTLVQNWKLNEAVKATYKGKWKPTISHIWDIDVVYIGMYPVFGPKVKDVDFNKVYTEITVCQLTNNYDDYTIYRIIDFK